MPPSQSSSTSSTSGTTSAQCTVDDDCAYLDVDDDPCTFAGCVGGSCDEQSVVSTPECQCHDATDCAYYEDTCNTVTCVDHLCATAPRPAGPAPSQMEGDCATLACDGATETPQPQSDLTDVGDDGNDCTADSCDASGPVHAAVADGAACGAGFCLLGECMPCVPANPAPCGDEGADEPANDAASTASIYARYASACGYLDGSDVDWYTFHADDDFGADILDFHVWASAPPSPCAPTRSATTAAIRAAAAPRSCRDRTAASAAAGRLRPTH